MIKKSLLFIAICFLLFVSSLGCHYSCQTCRDQYYSDCYSCSDSEHKFYQLATYNSQGFGICGVPPETSINGFGIFLLLGCIGLGLFLKSQHIFYFILSFQVFGLLSLMEIALPTSLTTVFTAFQYFMIFSQMQSNNKIPNGVLDSRHLFRMQTFMRSVDMMSNFTAIFVISFLAAIFLAILLIFRKCRQDRCKCIGNQKIDFMMTVLRTIILMTMQECLLIIYIGIRFDVLSGGAIGMIVLYSIVLIFLIVDFNWHRVAYFRTKKLLNLAIAQRFILPVFLILPFKDTYQIIIFFIIFAIFELIFYANSKAKTRHYVYSIIRLFCCLLTGVYVAVELAINNQNSANIAAIFATLSFVAFFAAFFVEVFLSVKEKCTGGAKVDNQEDVLVRGNTSEKIGMIRQDTMEQTLEVQIEEVQKERKSSESIHNKQEEVPNLLERPRKKEHKFRTHKKH